MPAAIVSVTSWSLREAVAITNPSTWRAIRVCTRCRSRSASPSVDATSVVYPARSSTSSMPLIMGGNSGLVRSGMTTPML